MKTVFVVLVSLAVYGSPGWAQENPAPPLADDLADGNNRDCTLPDKSCQKRETQRPATYPPPDKVVQRVDKLTGTATAPQTGETSPAGGSNKAK